MSAKSIILGAVGVVSLPYVTIWAHTESEYLNKARNMIGTLQSLDWECEEELLERQESDDPIYHWNYMSQDEFFGFFVTNGWTRSECEVAFDKYLSWISTNDMSAVDSQDVMFARGALAQCRDMKYTKALETIRTYALNPTAIDRVSVIDKAIRLAGVDESSASFVETVVTNTTQFSREDLRWVVSAYCVKLRAVNTNDASAVSSRDRIARLFYANRRNWLNGVSLDNLFVGAIPGFAYSSNRLDYANHVLSWATNNDWRVMRDHFVAVTDELLSSGHPLIELSVPSPG